MNNMDDVEKGQDTAELFEETVETKEGGVERGRPELSPEEELGTVTEALKHEKEEVVYTEQVIRDEQKGYDDTREGLGLSDAVEPLPSVIADKEHAKHARENVTELEGEAADLQNQISHEQSRGEQKGSDFPYEEIMPATIEKDYKDPYTGITHTTCIRFSPEQREKIRKQEASTTFEGMNLQHGDRIFVNGNPVTVENFSPKGDITVLADLDEDPTGQVWKEYYQRATMTYTHSDGLRAVATAGDQNTKITRMEDESSKGAMTAEEKDAEENKPFYQKEPSGRVMAAAEAVLNSDASLPVAALEGVSTFIKHGKGEGSAIQDVDDDERKADVAANDEREVRDEEREAA